MAAREKTTEERWTEKENALVGQMEELKAEVKHKEDDLRNLSVKKNATERSLNEQRRRVELLEKSLERERSQRVDWESTKGEMSEQLHDFRMKIEVAELQRQSLLEQIRILEVEAVAAACGWAQAQAEETAFGCRWQRVSSGNVGDGTVGDGIDGDGTDVPVTADTIAAPCEAFHRRSSKDLVNMSEIIVLKKRNKELFDQIQEIQANASTNDEVEEPAEIIYLREQAEMVPSLQTELDEAKANAERLSRSINQYEDTAEKANLKCIELETSNRALVNQMARLEETAAEATDREAEKMRFKIVELDEANAEISRIMEENASLKEILQRSARGRQAGRVMRAVNKRKRGGIGARFKNISPKAKGKKLYSTVKGLLRTTKAGRALGVSPKKGDNKGGGFSGSPTLGEEGETSAANAKVTGKEPTPNATFDVQIPMGIPPGSCFTARSPDGDLITVKVPLNGRAGMTIAAPYYDKSKSSSDVQEPKTTSPKKSKSPRRRRKRNSVAARYMAALANKRGTDGTDEVGEF